ncbi:hypothetical protein B0H63DRAFT_488118 [Podospora didyma]|uniref:ribonuclease Z n=1 Tax=Podospora didyma TaxID=330526 RepID=A0AAE0K1D1_9PEZI|nr:hypothetical protein B0H63DRAFT_488118 [Podospora didyma]
MKNPRQATAAVAAAASEWALRTLSHPLPSPLVNLVNQKGSHLRRTPPKRTSSSFSSFQVPDSLFPGLTACQLRVDRVRHKRNSIRVVLIPEKENVPIPAPNPEAGRMIITLLGTSTADTPGASVYVHFDNRRYLFGQIAEGTQRLMTQRKTGATKLQNIFLSGNTDALTTGGLLGMILTVADVTAAARQMSQEANEKRKNQGKAVKDDGFVGMNIHGGKNLTHMLASARNFVFRKGLPLQPHEIGLDSLEHAQSSKRAETPDWHDENLRVWYVPLADAPPSASPSSLSHPTNPKKRRLSTSSEPGPANQEELQSAAFLQQIEAEEQSIREAIVNNMFNSTWKLDVLRETSLSDVKMPAAIFVRDGAGHIQKYEGPLPGGTQPCPDIKVLVRDPWPSTNIKALPPTKPCFDSICYIAKGFPRRGKFRAGKALELGVNKTDNKLLTKGQSVTAKDGTLITPDMVMEPTQPARGFAFIDIRRESLVDSFLARPEWSNAELMQGITAMFWTLSVPVKDDARLVAFMQKHSYIKHVILGPQISPNILSLESPAGQAIKLNAIDPDRFPVPVFSNTSTGMSAKLGSAGEVGQPNFSVNLLSKLTVFDTDKVVPLMDTRQPLQDLSHGNPAVLALAAQARKRIAEPSFIAQTVAAEKGLPGHGVEIISLGTGSSLPSKYRNVSATLVRVPGHGTLLLDCGENTLGQIRRVYGFEGADNILRDLRAIYISHMHADHHLGVAGLVTRWRELAIQDKAANKPREYPLTVMATRKYVGWLVEYQQVEDIGLGTEVHTLTLRNSSSPRPRAGMVVDSFFPDLRPEDLYEKLGVPRVDACYVDHCHEALAGVFTWPESAGGLKVAFSGDCRPSPRFAEIGKGADLLIHECTFDDEMQGDAIAKKHSTMSEALDVGRQMGARKILLTHFSQRYPKLPTVSEDHSAGGVPTLFAFDYMSVQLQDFTKAEAFIPALRELFKDEEEEVVATLGAEADPVVVDVAAAY